MPDTKSPGDSESPEAKKGGPKRLVMIAALCVGLLGGGYVLGGKMSAPSAAADGGTGEPGAEESSDGEAEEDHSAEVGEVIDLEPVNINLADNHYLRIAISIGLSADDGSEKKGKIKRKEAEPVPFQTAPARDSLLKVFSGRSMEELTTPEGRDEARNELLALMTEQYHGEVAAVFFTEFVMQ